MPPGDKTTRPINPNAQRANQAVRRNATGILALGLVAAVIAVGVSLSSIQPRNRTQITPGDVGPSLGLLYRDLMGQGDFEALVEQTGRAIIERGDDWESLLFRGFALDELEKDPNANPRIDSRPDGLATARDVWTRLLEQTEPLATQPFSNLSASNAAQTNYYRAWALAGLGQTDRAQVRFAAHAALRAATDTDRAGTGTLYNLACYYALVDTEDHRTRATDYFVRAVNLAMENNRPNGMPALPWVKADPDLHPIRERPRFRAALANYEGLLAGWRGGGARIPIFPTDSLANEVDNPTAEAQPPENQSPEAQPPEPQPPEDPDQP